MTGLDGRPNDILDTPRIVLPPNSSRIRRRVSKVTNADQEVSEADFGTEGLMLRKGKKAYHRILMK